MLFQKVCICWQQTAQVAVFFQVMHKPETQIGIRENNGYLVNLTLHSTIFLQF